MSSDGALIRIRDLDFTYDDGAFELSVPALDVAPGEAVAVVGPSGSGKSTLLSLIAGILVPRAGEVRVDGELVSRLSDAERRRFRLRTIGFVFQEFELLDYLGALDNVLLPFRIDASLPLDAKARADARALLARVGLTDKARQLPGTISPGEKQRVAICRALVAGPKLVLADEPTSSLDAETARATIDCMFSLIRERGATLVMLTHDQSTLERFERVIDIRELQGVASAGGASS